MEYVIVLPTLVPKAVMTPFQISSLLYINTIVSTRRSLEKYPAVKKNAFREAKDTVAGAAIEGMR